MGLYNNGYRLGNTPFKRLIGGLSSIYNGGGSNCTFAMPTGALRSTAFLFGKYVGYPTGNKTPASWMLPQKESHMAMRTLSSGSMTANLIPSYPMAINLTGAGSMTADAAMVISMLLAMTGTGSLTAGIQGLLDMSIDLTGSSDMTAEMEGIATMAMDLLGEGDLEATIAAYGNMAIDIVVTGTGLSTANVGQAVWGAIASAFNEAGTMGNKLNTASSGGVDLDALAAAVLAALNATTIPVNVEKVNNVSLAGTGEEEDPWRPS